MSPIKLLDDDLKAQLGVNSLVEFFDDYVQEINVHWNNLTAKERAAYEVKSEALRQEAWAEFIEEQQLRRLI